MSREKEIKVMQNAIYSYYKKHGRHTLPWRKTGDPYKILVSEFMLQQTQVNRVIPKYQGFIKRFPTCTVLAQASIRDVLAEWSGLGYNRRAKYLHQTARRIVKEYKGKVPTSFEVLKTFPGIGSYTASAVCVFARNTPLLMLETNVRTVLIYHLFPKQKIVSDKELNGILKNLLVNEKDPKEWYWALMDYGAHLKISGIRVNSKSSHYAKQSPFKGSNREVRGMIIKILAREGEMTLEKLVRETGFPKEKIQKQLVALLSERMISRSGVRWHL